MIVSGITAQWFSDTYTYIYSLVPTQSPTPGYLDLADLLLGWDTFKMSQICYFFVASTLSSGDLCIFTIQGDMSYRSPFSLLWIMGWHRYSPAFRIIHARNVIWSLTSNTTPDSGGNVKISPTLLWRRQLSKCPPGGLSHQSLLIGKSKICSVFFLRGSPFTWWVYGCEKQQVHSTLREKGIALL